MPEKSLRDRLHEVVFEADTAAGKAFDVVVLTLILLSVGAVMLESVASIRAAHGRTLYAAEWVFTILFTLEYALRLACVRQPLRYASSFYGIVDLLAIVPTYLSILIPGSHSLLVIRSLRLLRIFRVFKLGQFVGEAAILRTALRASARKIIVFLGTMLALVLIIGTVMYLVEGPENGFTSIPQAVYWAIVTMTTVGYGDIAPRTVPGQIIASLVMILGYGIIAVPTGIVTVELGGLGRSRVSTQACPNCSAEGHAPEAIYCNRCGASL